MILRNRDLRGWGDRMVCAFTGHRPERLPWGGDEADARCAALRHRMEQVVTELHAQGYDTFLCGMARGCDTLFAESVLAVQRRCPVGYSAGRILTFLSLLIPAFSLLYSPQLLTVLLRPFKNAPLPINIS